MHEYSQHKWEVRLSLDYPFTAVVTLPYQWCLVLVLEPDPTSLGESMVDCWNPQLPSALRSSCCMCWAPHVPTFKFSPCRNADLTNEVIDGQWNGFFQAFSVASN